LGRGDQAKALWQQALALYRGLQSADANLADLKKDRRPLAHPQLLDQGQVVPMGWIHALREVGEDDVEPRFHALTASNVYLEAIYLGGDPAVRKLVSMLLTHRLRAEPEARRGQRGVAAILRDLAKLPIGTSQDRLGFLTALRKEGLIAPDEAVQFWNDYELREVQVVDTEISRGPEPSDLPEDLAALLKESILLHKAGRLDEAEVALNAILARIPDHQAALGNLAAIRAAQGRGREARAVLRRVIAVHPDYLFARCNLAALLIQDGALDEAQGLLAGLSQRPRLHLSEVYTLYGAMAMLNRARGQDEAAEALIASLEQMTEDEDDELLLAQAKARVERATAGGRFKAMLKRLVSTPPRPYKPKRR
jgi:tetratricopeptide (TPR) repeat protein